jgi:acyl-CoA synthetase (AMP-forming)/AMP-acid ligase II/acyl carrier protein
MTKDVFVVETSLAQRSLWFVNEMDPGVPAYNVTGVVRIKGPLVPETLERALNAVVERHEILRTVFELDAGEPVQVIHPEMPVRIPVTAVAEADVQPLIRAEVVRPFDLEKGPLLRMRLLRVTPRDHVAVLVMHHIVTDGWSSVILFGELSACYEAFARGAEPDLEPLPIQYADYAVWENDTLRGDRLDELTGYWGERLADVAPARFPPDHVPAAEPSFRGDVVTFPLPAALMAGVDGLARERGATPFMVLLAAFQTLLARQSGQYDVAVACPVANRERPEISGLIGYFVNTIIMRTDLSGDPTFLQLLERVRTVASGAMRHQQLPFGKLVEALRPRRHAGPGTPFARVMFVLQNTANESWTSADLTLEPAWTPTGTAKFEVTLTVEPGGDGHIGVLEYSTELFDRASAERLAAQFRTLLRGAIDGPQASISRLPLLTAAERAAILSGGRADPPAVPASYLHRLVAELTGQAPAAAAQIHGADVYVLDDRMEPVPAGVPGDLYVGGPVVARGYCMEPALTAERFVADPHADPAGDPAAGRAGGRLYRTGDIARFRHDGRLEFVGSAGRRVVRQGFPFLPEQVETVLAGHPAVADCAVKTRADGAEQDEPAAYLVAAAERTPDLVEVRRYLAARLPDVMVPGQYKLVAAIPRTPAGAAAWDLLPAFDRQPEQAVVAPRTPIEEKIAERVAELLAADQVAMNRGFLELGGHSLLAVELVSWAREEFDVELPLRLLYEETLQELARFVFDELVRSEHAA